MNKEMYDDILAALIKKEKEAPKIYIACFLYGALLSAIILGVRIISAGKDCAELILK